MDEQPPTLTTIGKVCIVFSIAIIITVAYFMMTYHPAKKPPVITPVYSAMGVSCDLNITHYNTTVDVAGVNVSMEQNASIVGKLAFRSDRFMFDGNTTINGFWVITKVRYNSDGAFMQSVASNGEWQRLAGSVFAGLPGNAIDVSAFHNKNATVLLSEYGDIGDCVIQNISESVFALPENSTIEGDEQV